MLKTWTDWIKWEVCHVTENLSVIKIMSFIY